MGKQCMGVVLVAIVLAPAMAVSAQTREAESEITTRGLAMGTGARASAVSTAALAYNPAGLAMGRLYHLEALVGYVPEAGRWMVGSTVVDSMTNKLAAGLSFRALLGDGERGYSGYDGRLGLGFPLSPTAAIGVSARYLSLSSEAQEGMTPAGSSIARGFTVDASLVIQPTEGLRIAALGQNLVNLNSDLVPTLVGGSASFQIEAFTIGADVLVDVTTFGSAQILAGGGLEYLASSQVPLRLGYSFDAGRRQHSLSGGVGYVDPKVGVDVSVRSTVSGPSGQGDTVVLMAVRYFVN